MIAKIDILALDSFINFNYNWTQVGPITIGDNSHYYDGDAVEGHAYLFVKVDKKYDLEIKDDDNLLKIWLELKYPNSFFIEYDRPGNCKIRKIHNNQVTLSECRNLDTLISLYVDLVSHIEEFIEYIEDDDYKSEINKILENYVGI